MRPWGCRRAGRVWVKRARGCINDLAEGGVGEILDQGGVRVTGGGAGARTCGHGLSLKPVVVGREDLLDWTRPRGRGIGFGRLAKD